MATKHTPGPWKYETCRREPEVRCGKGWAFTGMGNGFVIARMGRGEKGVKSVQEREANARLLAAAPELLTALREMVRLREKGSRYANEDFDKLAQAKAAITKAELLD